MGSSRAASTRPPDLATILPNSAGISSERSPQRGSTTVRPLEPRQQIATEALLRYRQPQRRLRGGQEAHVDRDRRRLAERHELALLDRAQQLGLDRQRQLRDLIEEQRPPLGGAQVPGAGALRAGEGPLAVAEQLRLGQRLGERRAVDAPRRPPTGRSRRGSRGPPPPCPSPVAPWMIIGRSVVATSWAGAEHRLQRSGRPSTRASARESSTARPLARERHDDPDPIAESDDIADA